MAVDYEDTLGCYDCASGDCECLGIHGCDRWTGRSCEKNCIEECYDDTECCRCGCNCQSASECYYKSIDSDHECKCEEVMQGYTDLHWDRIYDLGRE